MKQNFNVGIATLFGIDAAIIIDVMMSFCKCAKNCSEYRRRNKVFISKDYIWYNVKTFMPIGRLNRSLNQLSRKGLLEKDLIAFEDGECYTFTEKAKDIFKKKPVRLIINWQ